MRHRHFMEHQIRQNDFDWISEENRGMLTRMLQALVENKNDESALLDLGKTLHDKGIAFSQIAIFLDQYLQELDKSERLRLYARREILAKGYLAARLPGEIGAIKKGIHANPALIGAKEMRILHELTAWMEAMVESFLHDTPLPDIKARIAPFIRFVEERGGLYFDDQEVKAELLGTNRRLYLCAGEAVKLHSRGAYFHFTLVYVELSALFLKMATLLSSMFLEEELLSIYIDPVTHLPNRFQLLKDRRFFPDAYLLILNIRSFSKLNILYGYETGDAVLKKIAVHLQSSCALKSYRIYGDEFAVLVESESQIGELFERLNHAVSVAVDETAYDIYFYGAYDRFGDKALERCEFALLKGDKRHLTDTTAVEQMLENYKQELTLTQRLKEAMVKDEIIPYYQPIYANGDVKKVIKYEVLMRVRCNGELLSPAQFLPTLKEAPFYTEFTKSILLKAFELFKTNDLTFSVNFTLTDIKDRGVRLFLKTLADKYPDTAKRLTIEITEADALKEFDELNDFIRTYKHYGITFSLDDFGSGYSNFTQFAKLAIDYIKIDGTIVQELPTSEKMRKLLDSILEFAHSFELGVIAEYVSDETLFELLRNKVDMLQGYYIGKPRPYLSEPFSDASADSTAST